MSSIEKELFDAPLTSVLVMIKDVANKESMYEFIKKLDSDIGQLDIMVRATLERVNKSLGDRSNEEKSKEETMLAKAKARHGLIKEIRERYERSDYSNESDEDLDYISKRLVMLMFSLLGSRLT